MKFALLFLIITFATALPIHDVPTIADNNITIADNNITIADNNITIADNNITIADNNITIADNNITILTRTLLTTINDDDDFVDSAELVGATSDKLDKVVINSTSYEHLTSNLQVYRNHTSHHLQKLETTIVAMLNKTRFLQKEEELSNKKNYENEKKILNKKRLEHKKYEQHLLSLHQQIVNLNKTILEFWNDIHTDTSYLQKLELLKPKFIGSVDKVNNEMTVLNKYIVDTIIEGDDKKDML